VQAGKASPTCGRIRDSFGLANEIKSGESTVSIRRDAAAVGIRVACSRGCYYDGVVMLLILARFWRRFLLAALAMSMVCFRAQAAPEVITPTPLKPAVGEMKEPMPEAPSDGILDIAEIFSTPQRQILSEKIAQVRKQHSFAVYVVTYTFVYGEDANQRAERFVSQWLPQQQGAILVYDKGGKGDAPILGMAWRQNEARELPNSAIQQVMQLAKRAAEAHPANQAALRVSAATEELLSGVDRTRALIESSRKITRMNQLKILGGVLGAMLLCLGVLSGAQRFSKRREQRASESYLFPEVEISPRYGAPYGGGVVVQMHHGNPSGSVASSS
jgi:hypothetical protein